MQDGKLSFFFRSKPVQKEQWKKRLSCTSNVNEFDCGNICCQNKLTGFPLKNNICVFFECIWLLATYHREEIEDDFWVTVSMSVIAYGCQNGRWSANKLDSYLKLSLSMWKKTRYNQTISLRYKVIRIYRVQKCVSHMCINS